MKNKIIQLIKENCALEEIITEQTKFKEISIDSLSFISLIVNLETEFTIEFDDEELNIYEFETVEQIIKLVEGKINGK